jgi:hypothetical protein
MQIKSWEKPRDKKRKRNSKGKLASARLKQLRKRDKQLKKKLKGETVSPSFL